MGRRVEEYYRKYGISIEYSSDLAIAMRRKMNDWFRILQILQTSTGPGDDQLLQLAWNHVGEYFVDRQKWCAKYQSYCFLFHIF